MPVDSQVVRFQKSTGANGSTQDIGLNFTPKAIIVFSSGGTTNAAAAAEYQICLGFSDGTNHAAICASSDDGSNAADTGKIHSNADVFIRLSESVPTTTVVCRGSVAFQTNNLRFTWTVNDAVATYITVWAFGGNDITGVKVNTVNINETVNGAAEDYTGLGFTPTGNGNTALFLIDTNNTTNSSSTPTAHAHSMFTCATSTTLSKQWYVTNLAENAADPSDTWRVSGNDRNSAMLDNAGAFDYFGFLSAWITDGFRMTWDNAPTSASNKMSYLVINGGTWDSGTLTAPTSAVNDQDYAVSVSSNTIKGLMLASVASITNALISSSAIYSIGATDGTNRSVQAAIDEDGQATMDGYRYNDTTSVYYALAADGVLTDRATFDSFTTNNFRLDYPTKSGNAQKIGWVVLADQTTSALFERSINEATISVSETNARVLTANRSINEASISVSETNPRILYANRSINESSISVSETLNSIKIAPRTINEPSISVSETLARILYANRSINESSISVSETLARILYANRSINEPSISVSDAGTNGVFLSTRSITEPSISVSETLARQLLATRTLSESSISVSETLARILYANRSISEPSISVSDTGNGAFLSTRTINEPSISVSEILTKTSYFQRSISEASISVSETLARLLTATRIISEPSISVSETLARILTATRILSESSISVSETVARTMVFPRTISEGAISVSETVDRLKITGGETRTINEPSISVSETLARRLSATRTINEASITVSDLAIGEIVNQPIAVYITDPGYTNPVRFRVVFKSRLNNANDVDPDSGDPTTFYTYDSFVTATRPFNIIYADLQLAQGEIGIATMIIEDSAGVITNKRNISFNTIVEIDFKKELGREWKRMLTGFVRRIRTSRPAHKALLYQITILSKQIVFNERITNFKRAAKRTAIDSSIPLQTDSKMRANNLFKDLLSSNDVYPLRKPTLVQTGEFELDTGSISDEVTDFIAEIAPGLTPGSEVANAIAEASGAIWGCDEYGNPYLRYPTEKHSGIIITDDPQNTDSAVMTSVNMGSWEFEDSIDTSEGFANKLYVLNSKDTKSTASSNKASGSTTLTTRWLAQSFIATEINITGAAFILSKVGDPQESDNSGAIKGVLRADNAGFPTGQTLASFEIAISSLSNSPDVIFVNDIKTPVGAITPGLRYWWVLQGTNLFDDTNTVRWHHDNDLVSPNRLSARLPIADADPTTPGQQLQWIKSTVGPVYTFSTFSSIRHILTQSDPESIKDNGLIEAVIDLPAFDDDATFQKVLVKKLQSSAKVKRIYELTRVTIPTNRFFLPGEGVTIIDSKANLDSEKSINAEITETSYVFDTTNNALGCKYVNIRMIGFIDDTVDNYLENKEC